MTMMKNDNEICRLRSTRGCLVVRYYYTRKNHQRDASSSVCRREREQTHTHTTKALNRCFLIKCKTLQVFCPCLVCLSVCRSQRCAARRPSVCACRRFVCVCLRVCVCSESLLALPNVVKDLDDVRESHASRQVTRPDLRAETVK